MSMFLFYFLGYWTIGTGWRQVYWNSSSPLERSPLLTQASDCRMAQAQRIETDRQTDSQTNKEDYILSK
jgi:hypothetical protein